MYVDPTFNWLPIQNPYQTSCPKNIVENVIIAEKSKKTTTIIANEPIKNMKKGHADREHSTGSPTNAEQNKVANIQTPAHSRSQKAKKKGSKEHIHSDADEGSPNPSDNINTLKNENGNMQKMRSSCKAEELIKLKLQCEFLVRSCISGLLLTMSDQMFKEMEGWFKLLINLIHIINI